MGTSRVMSVPTKPKKKVVDTPASDDFRTPKERAAEIDRKKEQWLVTQPRKIQELAKKLDGMAPKEVLNFVRAQLTENVFIVSAYKSEIFWAVVHSMEIARRKDKSGDMIQAAKLLMQIERESINLLKGMDRSSFEIKGENVQVNISHDRDQEIRDAESTIDRYREVLGGGGTVPLDRAKSEGADEAADDFALHP